MRAVHIPEVADLDGADPAKLELLLAEADRARTQVEAILAEIAHRGEATKAYRSDGHKSTVAWLRGCRSWSTSSAITATQVGRLLADLPAVQTAAHDGTIGVDQIVELARVHANPRCGHRLRDVEERMLRHARRLPHADFRQKVRTWERLADEDGAYRDRDRIIEGRGVQTGRIGEAFALEAQGPALAGEQIRGILDRFTRVEFQADWERLVAKVGAEAATVSQLERTDRQRRFDALVQIFLQAASAAPGAKPADALVDVVIDHHTFERGAARLFGVDLPPDDPTRFDQARCHTVDGTPVDPRHAVFAALLGQVRRVLWTSPGVPTEIGSKQRIYRGAVRAAVELLSTHCVHPGCSTRTRLCQIDHLWPASEDGDTAVWNGGPKCGSQNRFTYRAGYHTWRDTDGTWHTTRPDGTEIGPTDWWDSG